MGVPLFCIALVSSCIIQEPIYAASLVCNKLLYDLHISLTEFYENTIFFPLFLEIEEHHWSYVNLIFNIVPGPRPYSQDPR